MKTKKLIALFAALGAGASFASASVVVPESALQLETTTAALAALEDYTFDVTYGGDFFASAYTFDFSIENTADIANGTVLASYWGSRPTDTYGANAFVFVKDGSGQLKLQVGRGKLSSTTIDGSTTFAIKENAILNVVLDAGVRYTISVTGTSGSQTVSLLGEDGVTVLASESYNGNMNGDKNPIVTGFNQTFNPNAIPEPSTFGLLAGIGALALVASRRRRARKSA